MTSINTLPIKGRARNAYPGDPVYILLHAAEADDGDRYEEGAEYVPLAFGADNLRRGAPTIQTVNIRGRIVKFTGGAS